MADLLLAASPNEKKRKRPRAARACETCRAKKYRCDELYPCSHCKRQKVECVYDVADHVRQRMFGMNNNNQLQSTPRSQLDTKPTDTALSNHKDQSFKPQPNSTTPHGASHAQQRSPSASNWTQINVRPPTSTPGHVRDASNLADNRTSEENDVEVSDVNFHTQNIEFHGKTSSIAFLAALQPQSPTANKNSPDSNGPRAQQPSLVSLLHNEEFSPEALAVVRHESVLLEAERFYFRQAQVFLDGYFQSLHFIHPILDRQIFMKRCEDLWFGKAERQPKSFVALYYSIMSLGALIKTWDEEKFDGLGRLEWSRKFFNLTRTAVGNLASMTALESVQCLFFMAKVSQNELNPSLAYLYLGWATRASCSAGFNRRQPSNTTESDETRDQIAKLWWGLYALEIEVSFALGRPDSLGADAYHNQVMPALDETETAIITVMVPFARMIREVSLSIYLSDDTVQNKTGQAFEIEARMDSWLQDIPAIIRPTIFDGNKARKITKSPTWAKRQRLVLELRFYNVKMVLFRPFLAVAAKNTQNISAEVQEAVHRCVDAAKATIEVMHEMYCHHAFFRTWWYNTTYIVYAASIVLSYGIQVAQKSDTSIYFELGHKAVEILDAMEESTVAKNASNTVQQILSAAIENPDITANEIPVEANIHAPTNAEDHEIPNFPGFTDDSLMSFLNLDENMDFLGLTFPLNSSHFGFWNDVGEHA